jgi:hypothetical protein
MSLRSASASAVVTAIIFFCGMSAVPAVAQSAAGAEALGADRMFAQAVAKSDAKALAGLLDKDFSWTDAAGKTSPAADLGKAPPKPLIADENRAQAKNFGYGQVAVVEVMSGRSHVLRVWVKRAEGWRALVYQEVQLRDTPPTTAPGTGAQCINPCKKIPYEPKTANERVVSAAYSALESSVVNRRADIWASLIGDEFVALSSNSDKQLDKQTRRAEIAESKLAGLAPTPLSSAKMTDFGKAVLMESEHQPDKGKPLHVTRIWVPRYGHWVETLSYQTTIQDRPVR